MHETATALGGREPGDHVMRFRYPESHHQWAQHFQTEAEAMAWAREFHTMVVDLTYQAPGKLEGPVTITSRLV